MRPIFVGLPFPGLGALSAVAQTPKAGRYVWVDTPYRKYTFYQDSLLYRAHGGSGIYGGVFAVKDMVWEAGQASFCIHAALSWGDFGWTDCDECLAGGIVRGQMGSMRPNTGSLQWLADATRNVMAITERDDTLRTLITLPTRDLLGRLRSMFAR